MEEKPFYNETLKLFSYVSEGNFTDLANLCDDDFGIVDIDTDGKSKMIRTRIEWENWFHELFGKLKAIGATTDTEILAYQSLKTQDLGYSVVEFCQRLRVGGKVGNFFCVVTIIWKLSADNQWQESRWHASLLKEEWQA
ncbi:MAG: hypothetical protein H7Y04_09190 [Verrucomicrobia bacterium]|nr:hypothetical protein [Cytophagales bacterium]